MEFIKDFITQKPKLARIYGILALVVFVSALAFPFVSSDKKLVEQVNQLVREKEDLVQKHRDAESKIDSKSQEVVELKEAIKDVNAKLDKAEAILAAKGEQISFKDGSISGLEEKNRELQRDKDKLHGIIEKRSEEVRVLNDRIKEQMEMIKDLQEQVSKSQQEVKKANEELSRTLKDFNEANQRNATSENELRQLKGQLNTLLADLSDSKTELNRTKINLNDAQTEIKMIKDYSADKVTQRQLELEQKAAQAETADTYKILMLLAFFVVLALVGFMIYLLKKVNAQPTIYHHQENKQVPRDSPQQ